MAEEDNGERIVSRIKRKGRWFRNKYCIVRHVLNTTHLTFLEESKH